LFDPIHASITVDWAVNGACTQAMADELSGKGSDVAFTLRTRRTMTNEHELLWLVSSYTGEEQSGNASALYHLRK